MADAGEARDGSRLGRLERRRRRSPDDPPRAAMRAADGERPAARLDALGFRGVFDTLKRLAAALRGRPGGRADVAKAAESSPDIVMKVAADGRILYANRSVEITLYEMGIPIQHAELLLPDGVDQIVRTVLGTMGRKVELLWVAEGRTIRYTVSGLGEADAVVFQGVDITEESAPADGR